MAFWLALERPEVADVFWSQKFACQIPGLTVTSLNREMWLPMAGVWL